MSLWDVFVYFPRGPMWYLACPGTRTIGEILGMCGVPEYTHVYYKGSRLPPNGCLASLALRQNVILRIGRQDFDPRNQPPHPELRCSSLIKWFGNSGSEQTQLVNKLIRHIAQVHHEVLPIVPPVSIKASIKLHFVANTDTPTNEWKVQLQVHPDSRLAAVTTMSSIANRFPHVTQYGSDDGILRGDFSSEGCNALGNLWTTILNDLPSTHPAEICITLPVKSDSPWWDVMVAVEPGSSSTSKTYLIAETQKMGGVDSQLHFTELDSIHRELGHPTPQCVEILNIPLSQVNLGTFLDDYETFTTETPQGSVLSAAFELQYAKAFDALVQIARSRSLPQSVKPSVQVVLTGQRGAGKSHFISLLVKSQTPLQVDSLLPVGSHGTTCASTSVTFSSAIGEGWQVEVLLDRETNVNEELPTADREEETTDKQIPEERQIYLRELRKFGNARPVPLSCQLAKDDGKVYYARDESGTRFYGDFSEEGSEKLAALVDALVQCPNEDFWFGEGDQIFLPSDVRITLSVAKNNKLDGVTFVDTIGIPTDADGGQVRRFVHQALRKRFEEDVDVVIVAYLQRKHLETEMQRYNRVLQEVNPRFHKSIHRFLIYNCQGKGEKDAIQRAQLPKIFGDEQEHYCVPTKFQIGPETVQFITAQVQQGVLQFNETKQMSLSRASWMAAIDEICAVAEKTAQNSLIEVLDDTVTQAYRQCGVIDDPWGVIKYNTMLANCKRGGDATRKTFSYCLVMALTDSLLTLCTNQTKLEKEGCYWIAKKWMNRIEPRLKDMWAKCARTGRGCLTSMRELLHKTFNEQPLSRLNIKFDAMELSDFVQDAQTFFLRELRVKDDWLDQFSDNTVTADNFLVMDGIRGGQSFGGVQLNRSGQKVWVKRFLFQGRRYAQKEFDCLQALHQYCISKGEGHIAPAVYRMDGATFEVEMEYLNPEQGWMTLFDWLKLSALSTPSQVQQQTAQHLLDRAVKRMHDACVYHLDLKPQNIMCRIADGEIVEVRLIDFGVGSLNAHTLMKAEPNPYAKDFAMTEGPIDTKRYDEVSIQNLIQKHFDKPISTATAVTHPNQTSAPDVKSVASAMRTCIKERVDSNTEYFKIPAHVHSKKYTFLRLCKRVTDLLCHGYQFEINNLLPRCSWSASQLGALDAILDDKRGVFMDKRDAYFQSLQNPYLNDNTQRVLYFNRAKLSDGQWYYYVGQTKFSWKARYPTGKHSVRTDVKEEWYNAEQEHVILCQWSLFNDEDKVGLEVAFIIALRTMFNRDFRGKNVLIGGGVGNTPML